jgi:hypothetical protein
MALSEIPLLSASGSFDLVATVESETYIQSTLPFESANLRKIQYMRQYLAFERKMEYAFNR